MKKLAIIHNRNIKFKDFDTSTDWLEGFPDRNWCLVIIADEENKNHFEEIIRKSIERNVGYIFSVGKQHEVIHTMAYDEIILREVENLYLPKHIILTAGEEDFEDGIWQGIYTTHQYETEIEEIIILDVTRKALAEIMFLIRKFETGYIPED